jgi:hypothetical protein
MSNLYGIVMGDRARYNATRIGGSKLNTYTNTWISGIEVEVNHNKDKGSEFFDIYVTDGSNARVRKKLFSVSTTEIVDLLSKTNPSLMDIYLRSNSNE